MAENIVAGLFGMNPQMYGEQQRVSALNEGIALAQLDPAARGAALTYGGARGLGTAIGGAFGVEDPQLKLISARNTIAQQIDQTNPESILKGAQMLAQAGDQQGAMALAQYARQAQSEMAQTQQRLAAARASDAASKRERAQADPFQRLVESGKYTPASLAEYEITGKPSDLVLFEKTEKPTKTSYGPEADRVSKARFGKNFDELTQAEAAVIDTLLEERGVKKAKEGASKLVLPGQDKLVDIPAFRASVQRTIEPQSKAVFAADNALVNIQDSIDTNNFTSFRAAQTQFARAISGSGDLSQKELLAAGADPALIGGTADYLAKLFTSTPTLDTQEKMKKTLVAIKKVSTDKAKAEIEAQRNIAYSNPGYDKARVDQALAFPEFSGANIATPSAGDYAAQARAILEQRKKVAK
jgi:hypothetical protein